MFLMHYILLTYFWPMFPFYTPWKHQKTSGLLVFSGGLKWEYGLLAVINIPLKITLLWSIFLFYTPWKHKKTRGFPGVQNGNIGQKYVNWPNFIVWLPLLLEILRNMCIAVICSPGCDDFINFEINHIFLIRPFFIWPKSQDKRSFKVK